MSRLIELKKQYPELNLSFFDIMVRMDTSKSYKYLPMLCKIFSNRFDVKESWKNDEYLPKALVEMRSNFKEKGINCDELSDNQLYVLQNLTDLEAKIHYDTAGFYENRDYSNLFKNECVNEFEYKNINLINYKNVKTIYENILIDKLAKLKS